MSLGIGSIWLVPKIRLVMLCMWAAASGAEERCAEERCAEERQSLADLRYQAGAW